jgi:outer membrane protein
MTFSIKSLGLITVLATIFSGCGEKAVPVQEKKIGYIDNAIVLNEFDLAVKARNDLQTAAQEIQTDIQKMEANLKALQEKFVSMGPSLSVAQQGKLRDQMAAGEQEYIQYVQAANQRAAQMEQEKMEEVLNALNQHVEAFARENGYFMILGATQTGNIVYADSTADVTRAVMAYIQKKKP